MLDTNFWKKYFEVYDFLNELEPYRDLLSVIVEKVDPGENDMILDVGSGTGNLALLLEERGAKVFGIDISPEGVEIHKGKTKKSTVIVHDITKRWPFDDNFFDKTVSNNTIYAVHPKDRPYVFKEMHRVLKSGGITVVSNIKEGFSPFRIYSYHVKKITKRHGFWYSVKKVLTLIVPTVKIFYYNFLIKRENKGGGISFMKPYEQRERLQSARFSNVSEEFKVYVDQGILVEARK